MSKDKKRRKVVLPPEEFIKFQWGGRTQEWEEEADQNMHKLQDQIDLTESDDEKKKKLQYAKQKQYW